MEESEWLKTGLMGFTSPISVDGSDLQQSLIAAELPPEFTLSVLRAYRLLLAWSEGGATLAQHSDAKDLPAWEREALSRLEEGVGFWAPISIIAGELQDAGVADGEQLAHAGLVLGEWAFGIGATGSGLLFVEVAALASPFNPRRAYLAGRMLLERGRMREAERWLRRTVWLAVASGDNEVHALARSALEAPSNPSGE
jgi:hypothetical protein